MTDPPPLSGRALRREVRALPPERRRALARAMRAGRAVDDPRDAALAVSWARGMQALPRTISWYLPPRKPTGWRAWLWWGHVAVMLLACGWAAAIAYSWFGGIARWLVPAGLVYSILASAPVLTKLVRMSWNAAETERRNLELLP